MFYIPFNSRNTLHKSKIGALRQNDTVTFNIVLPRTMACTGVTMVIRSDSEKAGEGFRIGFKWLRMQGENEEWWTLDYTPTKEGLLWYHFECSTAWGDAYITNCGNGIGKIDSFGREFQLTVYKENFTTPDWLKGGIIYQIFPDRFYSSGEKKTFPRDRILRSDWGGEPMWRPDENGRVKNNDYFGGDLKGIEEKLGFLKELGVSCIYLNPIFEANSNHRYDTADYFKIDPLLGDEKDFESLCKRAGEMGISIILDGVFSHTGDDSVYFNKYSRYASVGAYQSRSSKYFDWYKFTSYPNKYVSWWGIDILPEVDETNDSFIDFIAGDGGVASKWLSLGARGFRLDVADELPDKFLDAFRKRVKSEKSDAIVLGEVWEDASNKSSYGQRRRYLLGDQLDSVMNYPFSAAITDFIRDGDASGFTDKVMTVIENYPKPVIDVLMNHIGTHDTPRAITCFAGESCEYRDRLWQSQKRLSQEEYKNGIKLMKLATLIQFTLPGVPSIYYADEAGLQGYKDPFNRVCYPWGRENQELISHYRALGAYRRGNDVFVDGDFVPVSECEGVLAYIRKKGEKRIMVIINRGSEAVTYYINVGLRAKRAFFAGELRENAVRLEGLTGTIIEFEV